MNFVVEGPRARTVTAAVLAIAPAWETGEEIRQVKEVNDLSGR